MKLKPITVATLAALYAGGIGASVPDIASGDQSEVNLKQFIPEKIERPERTLGQNKVSNRVKQNSGLNVQLNRVKVEDKFKPESDIHGPQTYIVELFGNTVLAEYQQQLSQIQNNAPSSIIGSLKGSSLKSPLFASITHEINEKQDKVLAQATITVGRELETSYRFNKAINGFVTEMTQAEASRLATLGSVKRISRREILQLDTDIGPEIIGAPKVWQGETVASTPFKGEGIIAGVIDTGINTDHVSFSPLGDDGHTVTNPWGSGNYAGDCVKEEFSDRCNDKLIGVFSYEVVTDQYSAEEYQAPDWNQWYGPEEIRPRFGEDYHGHGSHTASTVAGNIKYDVPLVVPTGTAQGDGEDTGFRFNKVSGIAPHANIVSFQACYSGVGKWVGCPTDALVAAIEDAIEVGVDVLNFSIGSAYGSNPWESPTQLAFLNAHKAGISVAAAAGNAGTDGSQELMGYIDNTSPWLMTVAASTTGRTLGVEGKSITGFVGGDTNPPDELTGGSISGEITGNIVFASDFGDELCTDPFPMGTFNANDIVVCQRGEVPRVAKAEHIKAGGGGGMIMYNTNFSSSQPEGQVVNDVYPIPGIHLSAYDWTYKLKPWLESGTGHMATITAGEVVRKVEPDQQDLLADFSSRGPAPFNPEHLVPSVTAPGVEIYAANADDQPFTNAPQAADWTIMSGTSMASPHVAGALALIKEAHPDWTPAQINSALQMTADRVVKGRSASWQPYEEVGVYRAGSGRINVANAINTGLIMNETVENFAAANPDNGGIPTRLNLPELVNLNCQSPCTWVREVTATRDGTWNIETTTSEYSVKLSATPSSFTLKAGETRTIAVTAEILDAQAVTMNAEQEVWADVELVPTNPNIPRVYWPAVFKYDNGHLPDNINVKMHRDAGSYTLNNVDLPQVDGASYVATTPVKAQKKIVTLPQNTNGHFYYLKEVQDDDKFFTVDVPEGAARFIVETLARTDSSTDVLTKPLLAGDLDIYVGIDLNGDGIPQWDEEAICASTSFVELDYCNIDNPDAGTYWVVLDNYNNNFFPGEHWDTFEYTSAVVMKEHSSDINVSGPMQHDGLSPAEITIDYNFSGSVVGDIFYGAILFGTDEDIIGNIDTVSTKYVRDIDEFTITGSKTSARAGENVNINTHVVENTLGYDRNFTIDVTIPEHLNLVPGSVKLSRASAGKVIETDSGFKVTGMQQNSRDWAPDYAVTTSDNNPLCTVPNYGQGEGNYVNLTDFGFAPSFGGGHQDVQEIDIRQVFGPEATASIYNNGAYEKTPIVRINPVGYIQFDELPDFFGFASKYPYNGFPHIQVGVMNRGASFSDAGLDWARQYVPYNPQPYLDNENAGITIASAGTSLLVEWDNAFRSDSVWDNELGERVEVSRGDLVDFEVLYDLNYGYGDGDYEIIMAYDNISLNGDDMGAIGIQGFTGPRDSYGPVYGYLGKTYAYNDMTSKVKSDFAVCWDYVGPESTQFDISYEVQTKLDSAGLGHNIITNIEVEGAENTSIEYSLNVPSNIKVGSISDQTVEEDNSLEGLQVAVADSNNVPNIITVSGENISYSVNNTVSGGEIDIIPSPNFYGQTEVTVTVADSKNPGDKASTSFILIVTPTPDVPVAEVVGSEVSITEGQTVTLDGSMSTDPDGDTLIYNWSGEGTITNADKAVASVSGLSLGSHEFTLEVTDGEHTDTATVRVTVNAASDSASTAKIEKSSGGSFGLLFMAFVSILLRRRSSR